MAAIHSLNRFRKGAVASTLYLVAGFNVFPQKVIETNGKLPLGAARSCWWNLMKECHKDPKACDMGMS
ncbi:hypothetical protein TNCT_633221 [Trichonephila clavata]|uniref:Uncharacterized protein n=1 Tax=Trichonephila clavata TaxID=2740835 RepID=A0A8X6GBP9_TRICU|nr:hypothetical protein TNCT_633221 [Trichonephila clavata]